MIRDRSLSLPWAKTGPDDAPVDRRRVDRARRLVDPAGGVRFVHEWVARTGARGRRRTRLCSGASAGCIRGVAMPKTIRVSEDTWNRLEAVREECGEKSVAGLVGLLSLCEPEDVRALLEAAVAGGRFTLKSNETQREADARLGFAALALSGSIPPPPPDGEQS